jgi:hypothetical protein
VRGDTPVQSIRMREHAYNFSAHLVSDLAHAPYCTTDCLHCHATRRKLKLKTAYDPQREILRMRTSMVERVIFLFFLTPFGISYSKCLLSLNLTLSLPRYSIKDKRYCYTLIIITIICNTNDPPRL